MKDLLETDKIEFEENGYTKEEMKLIKETNKILGSNISITATAVRLPISAGHSESINITLEKSFDINTANQKAKDFIVEQDIEEFDYFEFRNNEDLSFNGKVSESRLFYAIYKGKIRLIDNLKI